MDPTGLPHGQFMDEDQDMLHLPGGGVYIVLTPLEFNPMLAQASKDATDPNLYLHHGPNAPHRSTPRVDTCIASVVRVAACPVIYGAWEKMRMMTTAEFH